jgi:hypothetical protein
LRKVSTNKYLTVCLWKKGYLNEGYISIEPAGAAPHVFSKPDVDVKSFFVSEGISKHA